MTAVELLKNQVELKCKEPLGPSFLELFEEAIDHYKINVVRLKGSVEDRIKIIDEKFDLWQTIN